MWDREDGTLCPSVSFKRNPWKSLLFTPYYYILLVDINFTLALFPCNRGVLNLLKFIFYTHLLILCSNICLVNVKWRVKKEKPHGLLNWKILWLNFSNFTRNELGRCLHNIFALFLMRIFVKGFHCTLCMYKYMFWATGLVATSFLLPYFSLPLYILILF